MVNLRKVWSDRLHAFTLPEMVLEKEVETSSKPKSPVATRLIQKRDVPILPDLSEYEKVAKEVGVTYTKPSTKLAEFLSFLHEKNWPIYDLDQVISYMTKVSNEHNHNSYGWVWKGLRRVDMESRYNCTFAGSVQGEVQGEVERRWSGGRGVLTRSRDWLADTIYRAGPVPLHALEKVREIEKAGFTPQQGFIKVVSDYEVDPKIIPAPDPFLMVFYKGTDGVIPRSQRFVIDFWDEPGFGLEHQLGVAVDKTV